MVKIVADTTSGLPKQLLKDLNIALIPQIVCFGEDSYRDDTEMDTAMFLQKLKSASELPKTAAPPPALYHPIIRAGYQGWRRGDRGGAFGQGQRDGPLRRSGGPGFPIAESSGGGYADHRRQFGQPGPDGKRMGREGAGAAVIVKRLNQWIPRGQIFFLVNTLEYLQKGGRIGGAKALLGEMLQIKPILCIKQGQVEPFEQQRTKRRALARLLEVVEEKCPKVRRRTCVSCKPTLHAEAEALAAELKTRIGLTDIPIYELPPAIVTHGGPGVLAVGFFEA